MTLPPPDGSRDPRIEDPTNLWIVHPAGRLMLSWFVARGISANAVSIAGFLLGLSAAAAYTQWQAWPAAVVGLLLSVGWLIADGLDGMVARATGTASAFGRFLDGLCDHGVFSVIYIALALSIGTVETWVLAVGAGALHAVQSSLYESERARFHRRSRGQPVIAPVRSGNPLVRLYDAVGGTIDRRAARFDDVLLRRDASFAAAYSAAAVKPLHFMSLLSANVRVYALFFACLGGNPALFWWFELIPLTAILIIGLMWHRSVEDRLVKTGTGRVSDPMPNPQNSLSKDMTK